MLGIWFVVQWLRWGLGLRRWVCDTWDIWPLCLRPQTLMQRMKGVGLSFERSWIRLPSERNRLSRACGCILLLRGCRLVGGIWDRDVRLISLRESSLRDLRDLAVSLSEWTEVLILIFRGEVIVNVNLVGAC
jgi:hypothetical protein